MQETRSDRWVWGVVLLAAAALLAFAIFRSGAKTTAGAAGEAAPKVTLPLLEGQGKASVPRGKVTVVDFWATWCAPCRASMPRLQTLWNEYRPREVDLFSVAADDPGPDREENVRRFLRENGLDFPVVLDDGAATSAFSVASIPTMVVLDRSGRIVWRHVGALTAARERDLRHALDLALTQARN